MPIVDLSRGLLVDPMLEIDAKSKGINQQQVVGTTLSNVVEGIEQAQDITNNQQVIEQNRQTIKAQEEKLKYLPQQLAIANANEVINFADKTIGMNHAEMEALAGADVATKAMGISQSARDSYQQFIQATPSEREALFDTPGFAQTVAQSPQLQKLIVPSLNEIIVNRTIGQNTEGLIRAEGLYGSIEGIYKPKLAGQTKKTEADYEAEKVAKMEATDISQQQKIARMGDAADELIRDAGSVDAAFTEFAKRQDPNYKAPERPQQQEIVNPLEMKSPDGSPAVSSDGETVTFEDGTTAPIPPSAPKTKIGQIPQEQPQEGGLYKFDELYGRRREAFMREQQLLGVPRSEAEKEWQAQIKDMKKDPYYKGIIDANLKDRSIYEKSSGIYKQVEDAVAAINANPYARQFLTPTAVANKTISEIAAEIKTAAGQDPGKFQEANQLIRHLDGLGVMQAKLAAPGSKDADAAKELELYMKTAISSQDTPEGMIKKLNDKKADIEYKRKRTAARQFLIDNDNLDNLESNVDKLVEDYDDYGVKSGIIDKKTGGMLPLDEEHLKYYLSPDRYFAERSKIEKSQLRTNQLLIDQTANQPSELFDPVLYDKVTNNVGTADLQQNISYAPEVQASIDKVGRRDPALFHKLAFGNPKGQAQMALAADGFVAMRDQGILQQVANSGQYEMDYASYAMTVKDLYVIAMNESSLNPNAVSPVKGGVDQGYKGMFQLGKRAVQDVFNTFNLRYKGKDANQLSIQDIDDIRFNPQTSFMLASGYLNGVLPKYGIRNKDAMLIAYNYNINAALRYQKTGRLDHLPKETRDYLAKFKARRAKISSQDASQLMMNKELLNPDRPAPETPENGVNV